MSETRVQRMPPGEITDEQARIMRAIRDGRFRTNEAMRYVIEGEPRPSRRERANLVKRRLIECVGGAWVLTPRGKGLLGVRGEPVAPANPSPSRMTGEPMTDRVQEGEVRLGGSRMGEYPIKVEDYAGNQAMTIRCTSCGVERVITADDILNEDRYACPAGCPGYAEHKYVQADPCKNCGELGWYEAAMDGCCSRRCKLQREYALSLSSDSRREG